MKYTSLFTILFSINAFIQAQQSNILPASTSITINVIAQDGKLALKSQYQDNEDFITISIPVLIDADIHLPFDISLPKDASHCQLYVELLTKQGAIIASVMQEIPISIKDEIILYDITERGLYLNETYELIIHHNLIGNKPCEAERPEFNWDQKKWPVLTTSIGLIGLGISEIGLRNKQISEYSDYTNLWKSGALETDAEPFRQDAEDTRDLRRVVTWGSGLMVITGTVWYIINKQKIKKRQHQFDRYCQAKPLTIAPDLGYKEGHTTLGMRLSYQF